MIREPDALFCSKLRNALIWGVISTIGLVSVPKLVIFNYVNLVVTIAIAMLPPTFWTSLLKLISGIFVPLWIEQTQCDAWLKLLGGHVWFDISVHMTGIISYITVWYFLGTIANEQTANQTRNMEHRISKQKANVKAE